MLWMALALAAQPPGPGDYAQQATVELPAQGAAVVRIDDAVQAGLGRDVLLVDAKGRVVPYARLSRESTSIRQCRMVPMTWVGETPNLKQVRIDASALPHTLDEIEIAIGRHAVSAEGDHAHNRVFKSVITVADAGGKQVAKGKAWRAEVAGRSSEGRLAVPSLEPGVYQLTSDQSLDWRGVRGCWRSELTLEGKAMELPVEGPMADGRSASAYKITLPAAGLQPRRVVLDVTDPQFRRVAMVRTDTRHVGQSVVERNGIGGSRVDDVDVPLTGTLGSQLTVLIEDGRNLPLDVTGATLEMAPAALVVWDAGPGPHRLLAGPIDPDHSGYDLDYALGELLEGELTEAWPEGWGANPDLDASRGLPAELFIGASIVAQGSHEVRLTPAVSALPGRWRLPPQLLAADPRANTLRIVDDEGNQRPYVKRSVGSQPVAVSVERSEKDAFTMLTLKFDPPVPVEGVRLHSESPRFDRMVRSKLDSARWHRATPEEPTSVTLRANGQVLEELELAIDNGDDLPLSKITAEAWAPDIEVVAMVPEGGATAYLGGKVGQPDYDLAHFSDKVLKVAVNSPVGEVTIAKPILPEIGDRWVATAAIAVLVAGLAFLIWRLIPKEEEEPADA